MKISSQFLDAGPQFFAPPLDLRNKEADEIVERFVPSLTECFPA
tara:strand:+ start:26635 stop:26766 length:132 start_codon:yes stop_codon:yes gene_type:complete